MFRLKYLPHREKNEKIIFFLHRHQYVLFRIVIVYLIMAAVPIAAYFFINKEFPDSLNNEVISVMLSLFIFTYYLYWWLLFYHSFLDYFLDVWIVTNRRVINIEQKGLFNRVIAEHKLFRIQDVMSEQKGVLPTFLNYGEVHVQTAGSEKIVIFEQVPRPHHVAREIIKLIENHKKIMAKVMEKIDKAEGI